MGDAADDAYRRAEAELEEEGGIGMASVRISWSGDLTEEQGDMLNDAFNVMGMQAAANAGLIPQSDVDEEIKRIDEKYK